MANLAYHIRHSMIAMLTVFFPHCLIDLFFAEHLAGMLCQESEHLKFIIRKGNMDTTMNDLMLLQMNLQTGEDKNV